MRKELILSFLFLIVSISVVSAQSVATDYKRSKKEFMSPQSGTVLIAAHRGAHNDFPENSIASFKRAIELGVDIIELDIRHTKDGVPVLMHDRRVDRTTNGKGPVDSLTFEAIRKLRLKHNGVVTDHQVPTLEEALTLARGKILVDLDMKTRHFESVLETVQKTKTEENVIFFLGDPNHVNLLRKKNKNFLTLVRTHSVGEVDSVFMITKTEAVHIDPSHNTAEAGKKIKSNGARIWINALGDVDKRVAANDFSAFDNLKSNGANIIQTDYPQLLLEYLRKKKLHE